jgi:hypothetical protein
MNYLCPYKGTPQGIKICESPFSTPRGWKGHMTRQHGEYTQEQLAAALGAVAPDSEAGRALFLSEGSVTDDSGATPNVEVVNEEEEAKTKKLKTDAAAKKLSAKFNKFQEKITERLTEALSNSVKEKGPEWAMSDEDRELFAESLENCFEVLDVQFNITPINATLTNPLWVLLLPLMVLALIFGPKAMKNLPKEKTDAATD